MASPIKMCENGHNICSSCKEHLSDCPNCRGTFINVRNITLEKLAATAVYPCNNKEAGCKETFTLDDRNKHLSVCLYESRKCPLTIMSDVVCCWAGTLSDISAHIRHVHDTDVAEMPGHFNVKLLDFALGKFYGKIVFLLEEFFVLFFGSEDNDFHFEVFHLCRKVETDAFKYGIKIGNSEEYVAVTCKCNSWLVIELTALQRRRHAKIHRDAILDFISESGYVSCEIEIGKEKLDGFVLDELQEFLPVISLVGETD
jgi:hypothetical protein